MDFQRSKVRRTTSFPAPSAPSTPSAKHDREMYASSIHVEDRHEHEETTYVYTDADNFRALVQQLTGNLSSPPQTPPRRLAEYHGKPQRPSTQVQIPNHQLGGGRGVKRASSMKLFERRRNAKKLEVKELPPYNPKRFSTPTDTISPISTLNAFDVFSEHSSGVTSPVVNDHELTTCCFFPNTPTSRFNMNGNMTDPEAELHAPKEEPRLLQLFPLHSSNSDG